MTQPRLCKSSGMREELRGKINMKNKLAINGGTPIRKKPWPDHKTTAGEEIRVALKVLKSGYLSLYEGNYFADKPFSFEGGPFVRKLEKEWARYYGVKNAIAVNSATSALYAAIGAVGVGPGDEVIVSPYTMSASAACALIYNAIPVFADIEEKTFNLDPESIEKNITKNTRAIVVVHIMGYPADMSSIMRLARRHKLIVIEDCAQAHGAKYKENYVGTLGDIGIFSLNVNKTIQVGEGGVLVTDNDELALRLKLIRNHGEVVADQIAYKNINNIIGYNYRMCETQAAMASEQLKKLKKFNKARIELAGCLTKELSKFKGVILPVAERDCDHVYYIYGMRFISEIVGISRDKFCRALCAEGIPVFQGYTRPLYLQQLYQRKAGYGGKGCPFNCQYYKGNVSYVKGICPVAERMYEEEFFGFEYVKPPNTLKDMHDVAKGFEKVFNHIDELKEEKKGML